MKKALSRKSVQKGIISRDDVFRFYLFSISLSYKAKINLALLFRLKNPENQYMTHKKYGVHLGVSGPFVLVCVCSTAYKLHTWSKKAHFAPSVNNILFLIGHFF